MPTMAEALQRQINVHDPYFNRGTMLPFGERTFPNNPHSRTEFAVPGAIYDPVMLGAKSMQQALSGQRVNPDDVTRLSLDLGMLGAPVGMAAAPAGALGMFAGKMAKTADLNAMKQAEEMLAKGADRGDVWKQTGWFKDVDGHMKFEIDDSGSALTTGARKETAFDATGQLLSHKKLYNAYPDLESIDMSMRGKGDPYGKYQPHEDRKYMGLFDLLEQIDINGGNRKSTALHELQHAVQGREGFARGASPGEYESGPMFDEKAKDLAADLSKALTGSLSHRPEDILKDIQYLPDNQIQEIARSYGFDTVDDAINFLAAQDQRRTPFGQYQRTSGEAEARNVETRMDYTPEQRRASPPWETLDVPENELIVRMQNALMGNK